MDPAKRGWRGALLGRPALQIPRRIPPIRRWMAHTAGYSSLRPTDRRRPEKRRARAVNPREGTSWSRTQKLSALLTLRRIRAHALILVFCLWGVCIADFAHPGLIDHAGNVKFQDFLPLYASAHMVEQHRPIELYNPAAVANEVQTIVHWPSIRVPS